MLILLSPAKNLDFTKTADTPKPTVPQLMDRTMELSKITSKLKASDLKRLMGISDKLADLNYNRFQAFKGAKSSSTREEFRPAALAFNGDVYLGLEAQSLGKEDFKYAQKHLRILSGFYGLLRPLDEIEPYRLEMGTRLKNSHGTSLYDFWGSDIATKINKSLKSHPDKSVINLASNEYFSAVDSDTLKYSVMTPVFKERKDGKTRQLMFYAKRARGLMARWIIENRVESLEDVKSFSVEGYKFDAKGSDENKWLFTRPQPAPKNAKKTTKAKK